MLGWSAVIGAVVAVLFTAGYIFRIERLFQSRNPADAAVDLGMERWHQQDLAEWDALFEKEIGRAPFPQPKRGMATWNELYAPGLQNAYQQQLQSGLQGLGMSALATQQQQLQAQSINQIMQQQAHAGYADLDEARARQQQQLQNISSLLGKHGRS